MTTLIGIGVTVVVLWLAAGWQGGRYIYRAWKAQGYSWDKSDEVIARGCILFGPLFLIAAWMVFTQATGKENAGRSWFR